MTTQQIEMKLHAMSDRIAELEYKIKELNEKVKNQKELCTDCTGRG